MRRSAWRLTSITSISLSGPTWCSMSRTVKDGGGSVMPSPSFFSTRMGTLKLFSSRNSTVSCAPLGFRTTSSALGNVRV